MKRAKLPCADCLTVGIHNSFQVGDPMGEHDQQDNQLDRRSFMSGALGAAAGIGAAGLAAPGTAVAQAAPPTTTGIETRYAPPPRGLPQLFRAELDIHDCEVEGKIPGDLNGNFYRTGPDAQYPMAPGNIPFDGEGHVSLFCIANGRVDFKSRFVRNQRYVAQDKAGKILFPMYRNPYLDDPSVKGLSRGTHNTHIYHLSLIHI